MAFKSVVLTSIMLTLDFVNASGQCCKVTTYKHITGLGGFYIDYGQLNLSKAVSAITCGIYCNADMSCVSYFYNAKNMTCSLHSVKFLTEFLIGTQKVADVGSNYYTLNDPDQLCVNYVWDRQLNKCYYFYKDLRTFEDAIGSCSVRGESLIKIDTDMFQNHIQFQVQANSVTNKGSYFTGASDRITEGTWKWLDGTSVDINYWADTYPKHQNEYQDYMIMVKSKGWKWQDSSDIISKRAYICERIL